jgi:2,4-dienoyl-CoA reductase-like NADH-dependent reductase (Old Yellow Enzyme family)
MKNNIIPDLVQKDTQHVFSRRDFLKLSAAGAAGAVTLPAIVGCGPVTTPSDSLKPAGAVPVAKKAFEAASIGTIKMKNRVLRSAVTMNGYGKHGDPKRALLQHYEDIARGGAGAIITGMRDTGMMIDDFRYKDEFFSDYKKVPDIIHKHNVPAIQQISHHGGFLTLTDIKDFPINKFKESDIEGIINGFVKAIELSKKLGFDGAQLHGAHGYALSQFLSPARNNRSDKWGGSTENRFRIVQEIFQRARQRVKDFPLLIKINSSDNRRNGMRLDEAVRIASLLEKTGFDAVEVSCGVLDDGFNTVRVPSIPAEALLKFSAYGKLPSFIHPLVPYVVSVVAPRFEPLFNFNVSAAREISKKVKIPVIVVGGIRNIDDINAILSSDAADFVSMGRPFIIEPDIVNRMKKEAHAKSECINCGYCLMAANDASVEVKCFYGKI